MPRERTREQELRRAVQLSGLPDGEVRLYIVLLDKADFVTAVMDPKFAPTMNELMKLTGKSRPTVFRRLQHLERDRWVEPSKDPQFGPGARIVRILLIGEPCRCPRHGGHRKESHLAPPKESHLASPKESHLDRGASERVSSCPPKESHLDGVKSLILKDVSAGQTPDSRKGQRGGREEGKPWPTGSIGEEVWAAARIPGVSGPVPADPETRRALRVLADSLGPLTVINPKGDTTT